MQPNRPNPRRLKRDLRRLFPRGRAARTDLHSPSTADQPSATPPSKKVFRPPSCALDLTRVLDDAKRNSAREGLTKLGPVSLNLAPDWPKIVDASRDHLADTAHTLTDPAQQRDDGPDDKILQFNFFSSSKLAVGLSVILMGGLILGLFGQELFVQETTAQIEGEKIANPHPEAQATAQDLVEPPLETRLAKAPAVARPVSPGTRPRPESKLEPDGPPAAGRIEISESSNPGESQEVEAPTEARPLRAIEPEGASGQKVSPETRTGPATRKAEAVTRREPDPTFNGIFVQLASYQSNGEADLAARRLRGAMNERYLSNDQDIFVVEANLRQGVVYRLRTGPFQNYAVAASFCDEIKARGGDCFVAQ
jgi:hypothetical protein